MSEFPVSKLEIRIMWGIGCAVGAVLLNLGTPLLLLALGMIPQFPTQQGPTSGMGVAIVIMLGIVLAGSAGLVAGVVRPGRQGVMITLICLTLIDVCLMAASMWLYFLSGAFKVALMIAVQRQSQTSSTP